MKQKLWKGNLFPISLCLGRSQEAVQSKKECLNIQLMAEREVVLFRQQLLALRQALARAQADNTRMRKQQDHQVSAPQKPKPSFSLNSLCKGACGPGSTTCCPEQSAGGTARELWSRPQLPFFLLSNPATKETGQKAFVFIRIWLRSGSTTHTKDHSSVCSVYVCVFL